MILDDTDERKPFAQEPPDQGHARLEVVGGREGLFVLAGGPAEPVDDFLHLDQGNVLLLRGQKEIAEPVLAHPLLDQARQLLFRNGHRCDPHRLLEHSIQCFDVTFGNRLILVLDDVRTASGEFRRELEEKALDARHTLPMEMIHEAAQNPLVEKRIVLLKERHDDGPFGFSLSARRLSG